MTPKAVKKAAKKAASRTVKSSAKPSGRTLVPQPHGGALLPGAGGGPQPGAGRPPDAIRARLREIAQGKGLPFLDALLEGRLPPISLLGKCDACAHEQQISQEWVELLMDRIQTSTDQRLKASDIALKYGLQAKELVIASDSAAAFFDCVHTAIVELGGSELADRVKARAIQLVEAKA